MEVANARLSNIDECLTQLELLRREEEQRKEREAAEIAALEE